jgi:HlyD family secretion protein
MNRFADTAGPRGARVVEMRRVRRDFDRELGARTGAVDPDGSVPTRRHPDERLVAPRVEAAARFVRPPSAPDRDARAAQRALLASAIRRALARGLIRVRQAWNFLIRGSTRVAPSPDASLAARLDIGFANELRAGLRVLVLGLGVAGVWAVAVPLSGAVVVSGNLVAESNLKKVQHPTGGVVAQILVQDGMRVKEGDLMVRLDETQARASMLVLTNQIDQLSARLARLVAERDGREEPNWGDLASRPEPEVKQLLASEASLFGARSTSRRSQKDLLKNHIGQLHEEIAGLEAQIKSKVAQLALIAAELKGVQTLYEKQLVTITRLTTLQRESARIEGERAQLQSSIAEAQGKISESELQIVRIDHDFRADVMKDVRESQDKLAELTERAIAARDLVHRIEIRAPVSGYVHQLAVHTVGGVIAAGEVIAEIVPDAEELQIEAHVSPNDIDHVHLGQSSLVRLSAFNQRTTPQLDGIVSFVSADLTHDKQMNAAFYTVRVTLPGPERRRLGDLQLVSGMPADVFLQTGSRTMASYLFKPITDQLHRSFREP